MLLFKEFFIHNIFQMWRIYSTIILYCAADLSGLRFGQKVQVQSDLIQSAGSSQNGRTDSVDRLTIKKTGGGWKTNDIN